jgi:hypothetical protein
MNQIPSDDEKETYLMFCGWHKVKQLDSEPSSWLSSNGVIAYSLNYAFMRERFENGTYFER